MTLLPKRDVAHRRVTANSARPCDSDNIVIIRTISTTHHDHRQRIEHCPRFESFLHLIIFCKDTIFLFIENKLSKNINTFQHQRPSHLFLLPLFFQIKIQSYSNVVSFYATTRPPEPEVQMVLTLINRCSLLQHYFLRYDVAVYILKRHRINSTPCAFNC